MATAASLCGPSLLLHDPGLSSAALLPTEPGLPCGFLARFLGSLPCGERVHQSMRSSSSGLQRVVHADHELTAASGVSAVIGLALAPWPDPIAV